MHVQEMISTHPDVQGSTNPSLIRCIEECLDCAQACTVCADACVGEEMVADLRQCVRVNLDCADICLATGQIASRRTGSNEDALVAVLEACETLCAVCAEECELHAAKHDHCRICAESCRRCEAACQEAAASITARQH
ncbi:MAG: four-helix bundle copper-binding protein [Hyphomonadaceae bacterium]